MTICEESPNVDYSYNTTRYEEDTRSAVDSYVLMMIMKIIGTFIMKKKSFKGILLELRIKKDLLIIELSKEEL